MLVILAAGCLLFVQGALGDYVKQPESLALFGELGCFFLWNVVCLSQRKAWIRGAGVLTSFVMFLWLHQALMPVLISGIYLAAVIQLGSLVRRPFYQVRDRSA